MRDGGGSLGGQPGERDFVGQIENLCLPNPIRTAVALLANMRSEEEVQGPDGRIPGSLLIPLPELQSRADEIPTDRSTVVFCHSGSCSVLAIQQPQKKGQTQVANLRGGMRAWKAQMFALEHT